MKKVIVTLLVLVMIMGALAGCGERNEPPYEVAVPEQTSTVEEAKDGAVAQGTTQDATGSEVSEAAGSEVNVAVPDPATTEEEMPWPKATDDYQDSIERELEEDPLAALRISEGTARNSEALFLIRGGKYYALYDAVSDENSIKYGIGYYGQTLTNQAKLYWQCRENKVITVGDVPLFTLQAGDKIAIETESSLYLSVLAAYPAEFVGYTVPIYWANIDGAYAMMLDDFGAVAPNWLQKAAYDSIKITDESGHTVQKEDRYHLNYGEEYTVSWTQGTALREMEMTANCHVYDVDRGSEIKLTYTPTSAGYATIDLSELEPGIYQLSSRAFIEIP